MRTLVVYTVLGELLRIKEEEGMDSLETIQRRLHERDTSNLFPKIEHTCVNNSHIVYTYIEEEK